MPLFRRLVIPERIRAEVVAHARAELPRECCGLLAGRIDEETGHVTKCFPIRNDLASASEYLTNPRDLLDAERTMRSESLEPLAIYHSHPTSEPRPSRKDLADNTWGEAVVHLIVGLAGPEPEIRAWWLGAAEFREANVISET